jgi:hypothetical protein
MLNVPHRNHLNTLWTPASVDLLKSMWGNGKTSSQIAEALGDPFTRSAVCAKIYRMKLPTSYKSPRKPKWLKDGTPVVDSAADLAIPAEQRKTLSELTSMCCRWPVGDPASPDFFFCGAPKAIGLARRIGDRDHTTVLHGHRKIQTALDFGDEKLASEIRQIKLALGVR